MNDHSTYYHGNSSYSQFLENQAYESFQKYIDKITELVPVNGSFLDVGCGTGIVVNALCEKHYEATGIEISDTSLEIARTKKGVYKVFDGFTIPFPDNSFDGVGSFNVLEHADDPLKLLDECLRVTKSGGYVFVCTPNFLSLTNSYHYRVAGIARKIANSFIILKKAITMNLSSTVSFDRIEPVNRPVFQPDDDAINLTNPFDLLLWARLRKLPIHNFVGSTMPDSGLKRTLAENALTKYIMGSVFVAFRKP